MSAPPKPSRWPFLASGSLMCTVEDLRGTLCMSPALFSAERICSWSQGFESGFPLKLKKCSVNVLRIAKLWARSVYLARKHPTIGLQFVCKTKDRITERERNKAHYSRSGLQSHWLISVTKLQNRQTSGLRAMADLQVSHLARVVLLSTWKCDWSAEIDSHIEKIRLPRGRKDWRREWAGSLRLAGANDRVQWEIGGQSGPTL